MKKIKRKCEHNFDLIGGKKDTYIIKCKYCNHTKEAEDGDVFNALVDTSKIIHGTTS